METIFWFVMLILAFLDEILTLYFYLAHDDLQRGRITPFEISECLNTYIPLEISIYFSINKNLVFQSAITIFSLIHGNFYLFLFLFPIFIFNIKILTQKDYSYQAFTANDYQLVQRNEKIIKYKLLYYFLLMFILLAKFMMAFSSMMFFRIFGYREM